MIGAAAKVMQKNRLDSGGLTSMQMKNELDMIADAKVHQQQELLKELRNWEDVRLSNFYFTKLKAWELLWCFLTVVHLANSVVIYELDFNNDSGSLDDDIEIQLWISTVSIFFLIILLNIRYIIQYKWMKAKKYLDSLETFWASNIWKYMIIETIITQIGPQVFLKNFNYVEYNYVYDVTITYKLNSLLWCFVWIKTYAIIRTIFSTNKFTSPRAQRIWDMNGCSASFYFSIKSKFKESSNSTLIYTFFTLSFIMAYMVRIFERKLSEVSGQDFNPYFTSLWMTIITMTTVGYGDFYPKSFGGRILGVSMWLWGVVISSLFVVTVSDKLKLSELQTNAYVLIQRVFFNDDLKRVSASAIFSMFRFSKAYKNDRDVNIPTVPAVLNRAEENFKRKMLIFKDKTQEMRKFDNATEYTYLSLNLVYLWESMQEFGEKQDTILKQQDDMIVYLTDLLKQKGINPDEISNRSEEKSTQSEIE